MSPVIQPQPSPINNPAGPFGFHRREIPIRNSGASQSCKVWSYSSRCPNLWKALISHRDVSLHSLLYYVLLIVWLSQCNDISQDRFEEITVNKHSNKYYYEGRERIIEPETELISTVVNQLLEHN